MAAQLASHANVLFGLITQNICVGLLHSQHSFFHCLITKHLLTRSTRTRHLFCTVALAIYDI